MSSEARVAVFGASGRMGLQVLDAVQSTDGARAVVGLVSKPSDFDPGVPVKVADDAASHLVGADVVVDFSSPAGFDIALQAAQDAGCAFVSGTTGLSGSQIDALHNAAAVIPVIWAANFSTGVNVLEHLVELASKAMEGADIEVFEAHHRHKVDAPSGTALFLGRAAARGRGYDLAELAVWGREGAVGPRSEDEIGFQVVRGGSIVGEHTVFFCAEGERIELTHRAQDRAVFARGAVRAAKWLVGRPAGRYSMTDVLFH